MHSIMLVCMSARPAGGASERSPTRGRHAGASALESCLPRFQMLVAVKYVCLPELIVMGRSSLPWACSPGISTDTCLGPCLCCVTNRDVGLCLPWAQCQPCPAQQLPLQPATSPLTPRTTTACPTTTVMWPCKATAYATKCVRRYSQRSSCTSCKCTSNARSALPAAPANAAAVLSL
jgi:hypothetical protein